jgi:hypothetical protein
MQFVGFAGLGMMEKSTKDLATWVIWVYRVAFRNVYKLMKAKRLLWIHSESKSFKSLSKFVFHISHFVHIRYCVYTITSFI